MNSIKNRYEFILGFVGLAISLSAFKEELGSIVLNLGFMPLALDQYFFVILIGLMFALYLFVIERAFSNTKYGNYKFFDYLVLGGNWLFLILIVSPVMLCIIVVVAWTFSVLGHLTPEVQEDVSKIFSFVLGMGTGIGLVYFVYRQRRAHIDEQTAVLEAEEVWDLSVAERLKKDSQYTAAIIEAFKVLELHIYRLLQKNYVRAQKHRFSDMLESAYVEKIIDADDVRIAKAVFDTKNKVVHMDVRNIQLAAEEVLEAVKRLVGKQKKKKR